MEWWKIRHKHMLGKALAWLEVLYANEKTPGWLADSLINALYMITEDVPIPILISFTDPNTNVSST